MENHIIKQIKEIFQKEKHNYFWDNIDLNNLKEECYLKDSLIFLKNDKIVAYFKFSQLDDFIIENEIIYNSSPIYMGLILKIYNILLKNNFKVYVSIFKNNKKALINALSVGFEQEEKMFSFCIENEFYEQNKQSFYLENTFNLDNGFVGYNGCYLFFETEDILYIETIEKIKQLAKELNIRYIVFFSQIPNQLINKYPYKIINSLELKNFSKTAINIIKKYKINDIQIINNLSFLKDFDFNKEM